MPKFTLTQDQIADIAAFLHAQADAKANRMDYTIQNVVTGNARAGQAYFAAHCAACHSATGDLAGIAKKYEPAALQSRFLYPKTFRFPGMPDEGRKPAPTKVTVTVANGESISGTLEHMDDFNVAMRDSQGVYHSWLRSRNPGLQVQVADPLEGHVALLQQYSNSDMHNILAYLETLK
jgi:cytochrome c oxidase cbb3-type subunit III